MNWPVAAVAQKKLIFDDEEIVPYLKAALSSGDEDWVYFLRKQIIPKMSEKIKTMLQMEKTMSFCVYGRIERKSLELLNKMPIYQHMKLKTIIIKPSYHS